MNLFELSAAVNDLQAIDPNIPNHGFPGVANAPRNAVHPFFDVAKSTGLD